MTKEEIRAQYAAVDENGNETLTREGAKKLMETMALLKEGMEDLTQKLSELQSKMEE